MLISKSINYKYNVSEIMTSWLTQEGYPIVNVTSEISKSNKTIASSKSQNKISFIKINHRKCRRLPLFRDKRESKMSTNSVVYLLMYLNMTIKNTLKTAATSFGQLI